MTPPSRIVVLEIVGRLAASGVPYAQAEALKLAERYRDVIRSAPAPWLEPGSERATEAMGFVVP